MFNFCLVDWWVGENGILKAPTFPVLGLICGLMLTYICFLKLATSHVLTIMWTLVLNLLFVASG